MRFFTVSCKVARLHTEMVLKTLDFHVSHFQFRKFVSHKNMWKILSCLLARYIQNKKNRNESNSSDICNNLSAIGKYARASLRLDRWRKTFDWNVRNKTFSALLPEEILTKFFCKLRVWGDQVSWLNFTVNAWIIEDRYNAYEPG